MAERPKAIAERLVALVTPGPDGRLGRLFMLDNEE
jgi:hypothetical protein